MEEGLAIVTWICEKVGEEKDEGLIESLSRLFEVQKDSVDDFLKFGYSESLDQILMAGIEKCDAGLYDSDLLLARQHDKYDVFMKYFPSQAYFAGIAEGSLERLRRDSRVLAKFRESYSATTEDEVRISTLGRERKWPWNIGEKQPASLTCCMCSPGSRENCPICQLSSSQNKTAVDNLIEQEIDRKKKIALEKQETKKKIEESNKIMREVQIKAEEEEEEILAAEEKKRQISASVEKAKADTNVKFNTNSSSINNEEQKKGSKKKSKKKK